MVIWLTGNSGAGKTTLAKKLAGKNTVILDGDITRTVWPGLTLSKEDRWEQGLRNARLAKMLEDQGFAVIVAVIAPYEDLRKEIKTICDCKFIYMEKEIKDKNYPYEPPLDPILTIKCLKINYRTATLVDPTTVTFKLKDPAGTLTTYVYGTDA